LGRRGIFFDAPDSESTGSSVSCPPFDVLSSPSLSLLVPLSAGILPEVKLFCKTFTDFDSE
jgi:hypothetical protein